MPADPNLLAAFDRLGVDDAHTRAGIAAIAMGESGLQPKTEADYHGTANDRIRAIFGARVPASDAELNVLKRDPVAFFDRVYGGRYGNRPGTHDGYDYRGRGLIQHTFRGEYETLSKRLNRPEILSTPDVLNQPEVAAEAAIDYIRRRWDGRTFESMMTCVGYNIPSIAATKRAAYARFMASGEYGPFAVPQPIPAPAPGPKPTPAPKPSTVAIPAARDLQAALVAVGLLTKGDVDGVWGPISGEALRKYYAR